MNAVIPHADARPSSPAGALPAAGPWHVRAADPALAEVAETVRALLAPHLPDAPGGEPCELVLGLDELASAPPLGVSPGGGTDPVDEGYRLRVAADGITCHGLTPAGVFRGAATALQLIATGQLAYQELADAPRYAWRGLMVDPARSFLTPDEVRRIIDLAALYKLNVLHLHLTDNEGWRIELPGTPALTAPGAEFYTAAEYRELQTYAARRFVTVVPEIDLPGHCATLRAAVPGLPPAPAPAGLTDRFPFVPPLDLTDPATRTAVARVLTEVCALTAGPYVHIGADEAFGATPESFDASVRELRALVRELGKRPVAWQESSRAGTEPGDIAQYWVDVAMMDLPDTAEELAARPELVAAGRTVEIIAALKKFFAPTDDDLRRTVEGGGRVLLSPQSHLYLDRPYAAEFAPPGQAAEAARLGFDGYRPLGVRHTAAWDPGAYPIPDANVAGVEATVFAERFKGFEDVSLLLLPRLASVAEAAWCGRAPEWAEYRERLAHHGRVWAARGLPYFASTEVDWR
ncbi:beta-N-acetylhexosaminidase [Streptomyces sp. NBC_00726]|uniref:family 20 glycosylhydrolase n=1 Tax=Streptomyces sp. NBC_00726 TaxID=2903674 RepID=UPI003864F601